MPESLSCPRCGATNPGGAQWCGQCFVRFGEDEPQDDRASRTSQPSIDTLEQFLDETSPPTGDMSQLAWDCPTCDSTNSIDDPVCHVCGTSMFDSFGETEPPRNPVEPGQAMLWAVVPGLGHARAGQGLLGFSIGLLIVLAVGFGVLFTSSGGTMIGLGMVIAGLILWGASSLDAYRWAAGDTTAVLLRPRVVTIAAGVVWGMMVLGFVLTSSRLGEQ